MKAVIVFALVLAFAAPTATAADLSAAITGIHPAGYGAMPNGDFSGKSPAVINILPDVITSTVELVTTTRTVDDQNPARTVVKQ